ncbi:hypothetical protein ACTFIV_008799 [Dictyostelium citrinum]
MGLDKIRNKTFIGEDLHLNRYYQFVDREGNVRRDVDYFIREPNPRSIPSIWNRWLAFRVDEPPTYEEVLKEDQRQRSIKEKAKVFEEEDLKLRVQEMEYKKQQQQENLDNRNIVPKQY